MQLLGVRLLLRRRRRLLGGDDGVRVRQETPRLRSRDGLCFRVVPRRCDRRLRLGSDNLPMSE